MRTLSKDERELIVKALRFTASNVDEELLGTFGYDELDPAEHGVYGQDYSDAYVDEVMSVRIDSLERELNDLANKFEKEG